MKGICLLSALVVFLQNSYAQRNIEGTWEGKLAISAIALRTVVHIKTEAGTYRATIDSPDQGIKDIPVSSVKVKDDSLFLEVASMGAKIYGKLTSDTTFSGELFQGISLPL